MKKYLNLNGDQIVNGSILLHSDAKHIHKHIHGKRDQIYSDTFNNVVTLDPIESFVEGAGVCVSSHSYNESFFGCSRTDLNVKPWLTNTRLECNVCTAAIGLIVKIDSYWRLDTSVEIKVVLNDLKTTFIKLNVMTVKHATAMGRFLSGTYPCELRVSLL